MENNKQTGVEWLIEQYTKKGYIGLQDELQAKEMENQQRKESYDNGYANGQMDLITD